MKHPEPKFKVGDKVKVILDDAMLEAFLGYTKGVEGTVTKLGGIFTPDEGAVVTNETFSSEIESYGEHGLWFGDKDLELIETEK